MGQKTLVFLLLVFMPILAIATTYNPDSLGLMSLKDDWKNTPPGWTALDPCSEWEGIECTGSRVTSIKLSSMGLEGTMSGEIQKLSELQMLDLSYNKYLTGELPPSIGNLKRLTNLILVGCSFSGTIPDTIGSLEQLVFLSLNSNKFSGRIPPSIGNLSKLYWLDMADNNLEGPIPVSNGSTSGLDMLLHTKHFHFGKNKLSGEIPEKLFRSSMKLIHVLFESNELTGKIPSTLGLVQTLEVVRFDRNNLVGTVPSNLNNLTSVNELYLSNNKLSGPLPSMTGMNSLAYLDMSNNSFDVSKIPTWFSTLTSLTTLMMESTGLGGELPVDLFSLPSLQTVVLKNNQVNGTLDIGTTYSNHLQLIDLQYNSITDYKKGLYNDTLILANNPVCLGIETGTESYCKVSTDSQSDGNSTYTTLPNNCVPGTCSRNQISSPNCRCAYPYTGILEFRAPSFSDLGNKSIYKELENKLLTSFQSYQLLVDSVALSNPKKGSIYLDLSLEVFPYSRDRFNRTEISEIGFLLSNQTFKPPKYFGPFVFHGDVYENYQVISTEPKKSKSSIGIIIGAAAGGSVLVLLLLLAGVYAFRQKRRAERSSEMSNPFGNRGSWKLKLGVGLAAFSARLHVLVVCLMRRCFFWRKPNSAQQNVEAYLRIHGPLPTRRYSYLDVKKMTNTFTNKIGQGGYGSVYKGKLQNGCPVAVKVLNQSKGNGEEFINEVATISRTSHVNIVALLGFCVEGSKRALIYEFLCNGSLEKFIFKENDYQKENHQLEWGTLYLISLGIARGLEYLHRGCNTRILHFDIKPHNILLDKDFSPKISDFGLAKLCTRDKSIISLLDARGTIGYIAPEIFCRSVGGVSYKSDVYSYGMMVLEMIGGRKNVNAGADHTSEIYFPHWIYKRLVLDEELGLKKLKNQEDNAKVRKMVTTGLWCIQTDPSDRPTMSKVIEMLEGSVDSLQVPPKPFLSSPSRSPRSPTDSSTSLPQAWSHGSNVANT